MRIRKSFLAAALALLQSVPILAAAPDETPSAVGEATQAVVDRVFGVKGEAGNIDYHVVEFTKVSPMNSAVRSFFIPGWGQHFNHQRVKGSVLFISFAATTFGALHLNAQAKETYNDYEERGYKDDPLFDDYENEKSKANFLGITAGVLWAFAIFDAYRNAYNPLYSRAVDVELAYAPDESSIRLSRKF